MQKDFPVDENSNGVSVIQRIQKNQVWCIKMLDSAFKGNLYPLRI